MKRAALLLFCTLLATSCGFELRGMNALPSWLNHVYIDNTHGHRDITLFLKEQLQSYHVDVLPTPRQAQYILVIDNDNIFQQIAGVSASTTPRRYQLMYQVSFHFIKRNGKELIPESKVTVTRQLTVNNNRILGSNYEETLIAREMHQSAANKILHRISAL